MGTFAIGLTALVLSAVNTVGGLFIAWWVAHRDRARLVLTPHGGYIISPDSAPLPIMSPSSGFYDVRGKRLFMLNVANTGRRPLTITGGGMKYRTTGIWRLIFWDWSTQRSDKAALTTSQHRLPVELNEQKSFDLLAEMDNTKEHLQQNLKSPHQLGPVFVTDVAGKEYVARMPRSLWRELAAAMRSPAKGSPSEK